MQELTTIIKNIEEAIEKGNYTEAGKKIPKAALLLVDQIKRGKLFGDQLDQISDRFFTLFETQLEKKPFSGEIGDLLFCCFNLHTVINSKGSCQNNKKFWEEIEKIEKLAQKIAKTE